MTPQRHYPNSCLVDSCSVRVGDPDRTAGRGAAGDTAIINAILADLDATFPQTPNGATANYIEGHVHNWGAHPYTLGVYSYPKVGTYTTANDVGSVNGNPNKPPPLPGSGGGNNGGGGSPSPVLLLGLLSVVISGYSTRRKLRCVIC